MKVKKHSKKKNKKKKKKKKNKNKSTEKLGQGGVTRQVPDFMTPEKGALLLGTLTRDALHQTNDFHRTGTVSRIVRLHRQE